MKRFKKWLSLSLALLMLLSAAAVFAGCGKTADDPAATETGSSTLAEGNADEVDNRFNGVNYNDREFRIYTSAASNGCCAISG